MTLLPIPQPNSYLPDRNLYSTNSSNLYPKGFCVGLQPYRSTEREPAPMHGASEKRGVDRYLEEGNGLSIYLVMFILGIDVNDTAFRSTSYTKRKILHRGRSLLSPQEKVGLLVFALWMTVIGKIQNKRSFNRSSSCLDIHGKRSARTRPGFSSNKRRKGGFPNFETAQEKRKRKFYNDNSKASHDPSTPSITNSNNNQGPDLHFNIDRNPPEEMIIPEPSRWIYALNHLLDPLPLEWKFFLYQRFKYVGCHGRVFQRRISQNPCRRVYVQPLFVPERIGT